MRRMSDSGRNVWFRWGIIGVVGGMLAAAGNDVKAEELPCEAPGELVRVAGKIRSNAFESGETLGVFPLSLPPRRSPPLRLECGINGKPVADQSRRVVGFVHTIVCNDSVRIGRAGLSVHSQMVTHSHFDGLPDFRTCGVPGVDPDYGTFREISEPQSGRGIFSPTGGGRLFIEGQVNCAGAVDMRYRGEVCVVRGSRS